MGRTKFYHFKMYTLKNRGGGGGGWGPPVSPSGFPHVYVQDVLINESQSEIIKYKRNVIFDCPGLGPQGPVSSFLKVLGAEVCIL